MRTPCDQRRIRGSTMINRLRGRIPSKHPPFLLLDVNGVGYDRGRRCRPSMCCPAGDEEVTLHPSGGA